MLDRTLIECRICRTTMQRYNLSNRYTPPRECNALHFSICNRSVGRICCPFVRLFDCSVRRAFSNLLFTFVTFVCSMLVFLVTWNNRSSVTRSLSISLSSVVQEAPFVFYRYFTSGCISVSYYSERHMVSSSCQYC